MKMGSRKLVLALVVLAVAGAATVSATAAGDRVVGLPPLSVCLKRVKSEVKVHGTLTVATNDPALSPWFKDNDPSNGKGYESAVAYRVASTLGFKRTAVKWYTEPYELSEQSGAKPFDFDVNEIVYAASLTSKVTFSTSYYNVDQVLVALRSSAVVTRHSPKELRSYLYGALKGSPGLAVIESSIKPTHKPMVFTSLTTLLAAVQSGEVAATLLALPTGQWVATQVLHGGDAVAQLRTDDEHYVLLLQKASVLTGCVNTALRTLASNGTLSRLSKQYLGIYNSIPVISP